MALSFVGGDAGGINNGSNVTLTLPAGIASGDVVYVGHSIGSDADETLALGTSGYTQLINPDIYSDDTLMDQSFTCYRKIMGGTPDSTVQCNGNGVTADATAATFHCWSGADQTTPEDNTTVSASGIDSTIPNPGEIETVTPNAVVVIFGCGGVVDTAVTAPTGYENQSVAAGNDTNDTTHAVASKLIASPTAENPAAWTNWATGSDRSWAAATVAIRPAAEGGGGSILLQMLQHGLFIGMHA